MFPVRNTTWYFESVHSPPPPYLTESRVCDRGLCFHGFPKSVKCKTFFTKKCLFIYVFSVAGNNLD